MFCVLAAAATPSAPSISAVSISASVVKIAITTPSFEERFGVKLYRLYRAQGGLFTLIAVLQPTDFPYADTGLAQGTYNYQLCAVNNSTNQDTSGFSPIATVTTQTQTGGGSGGGAAIQLTSGHWVTLDRGSGSGGASGQLAFINSIAPEPTIVGVVLAGFWPEYDAGKSGPDYTAGDVLVDSWAAACASAGKKLILRADWSKFSLNTPTNPLGCCPSYFVQNSSTKPSYTLRPANTTWAGDLATSACYWYGPTMDAFIALVQHLGNRYASNPVVEGMRFSETASAAPTSVGNTTSNAITQWKRLMVAARAAWPGKEISIAGNYLGSDTDVLGMITAGVSSKVLCTAGPDSGPQRSYQFNQVFNGYLNGVKSGTDYRGAFPNISESEYPNEASGGNLKSTTPSILYNWQLTGDPSIGGGMNPNKFIWQQSTYLGAADRKFDFFTWPAVLAFIKSIGGACNTVRPPGY